MKQQIYVELSDNTDGLNVYEKRAPHCFRSYPEELVLT